MKTAIIDAMGWMLLHSLWQAAFLWLIAKVLTFILRKQNAQTRYLIWTGGLCIMVFSAISCFFQHFEMPIFPQDDLFSVENTPTSLLKKSEVLIQKIEVPTNLQFRQEIKHISDYFPIMIPIWILGVLFFSLKYLISYFYIEKIKRNYTIALSEWDEKMIFLQKKLKIPFSIQLLFSNKINSPLMVGYFKSFIIIPLGLITRLDVMQIESLILHELAHIKRHDYLINIFQCVIESLFFFNPFVHFISKNIRLERENACDEWVISKGQKPDIYAEALSVLAQFQLTVHTPALSAADNSFYLLNRIKNIMTKSHSSAQNGTKFLSLSLLLLAFAVFYGFSSPTLQAKMQPFMADISQKAFAKILNWNEPFAEKSSFFSQKKEIQSSQNELFTPENVNLTPPDTLNVDSLTLNYATNNVQVYKQGKIILDTVMGDLGKYFNLKYKVNEISENGEKAQEMRQKMQESYGVLGTKLADNKAINNESDPMQANINLMADKIQDFRKKHNYIPEISCTSLNIAFEGARERFRQMVTERIHSGANMILIQEFLEQEKLISPKEDYSLMINENYISLNDRRLPKSLSKKLVAKIIVPQKEATKPLCLVQDKKGDFLIAGCFAKDEKGRILAQSVSSKEVKGVISMEDFLLEKKIIREGEGFRFKFNDKGAFLNGKALPTEIQQEIKVLSCLPNPYYEAKKGKYSVSVIPNKDKKSVK